MTGVRVSSSLQDMIQTLKAFWATEGCAVLPSYDMFMGAGTFHPETLFRALGPTPFAAAFVQPSRRPRDGRYGRHPNRFYRHHQFQVILKPSPENVQDLALKSLQALGIDPALHDLRFVEDNWESPTLGASGLGWEVWCDGMEVLQFTYFQQIGGIPCAPVTAELTYGLERLAMYLQNQDNAYDLLWRCHEKGNLTYGDLYQRAEHEWSTYALDKSESKALLQDFTHAISEGNRLTEESLIRPAYEWCIQASHLFNMLDARGAISAKERVSYIADVRHLVAKTVQAHCAQ